MKIAVCFMGIVGGVAGPGGEGGILDPSLSYQTFKENVIDQNDEIDVFIHTWSVEKKKQLIELYQPKSIIAEESSFTEKDMKGFGVLAKTKPETRIRSFCRWNSNYKVIQLKKEYEEENNFNYDCVFVTRLDLNYKIPFQFNDFNLDYLYIPNFRKYKQTLNGNQWGDTFYFSNSKMIDNFLVYYKDINAISQANHWRYQADNAAMMKNYIHRFTKKVKESFVDPHEVQQIRKENWNSA